MNILEKFLSPYTKTIEEWKSEGFFNGICSVRIEEANTSIQQVANMATIESKLIAYFNNGEDFFNFLNERKVEKFFSITNNRGAGVFADGSGFKFSIKREANPRKRNRKTVAVHDERNNKKDWTKAKGERNRRRW